MLDLLEAVELDNNFYDRLVLFIYIQHGEHVHCTFLVRIPGGGGGWYSL